MLYLNKIPAKTYEELLQENLGKIPIYSGEWTNYNPADPGITTLENFTALQIIQQNRLDEMPEEVRIRLLELLGYRQRQENCAEVWLEAAGVGEAIDLLGGQRFMAGDISFETTRHSRVSACRIKGVYSQTADTVTDCSHILDRNVRRCAAVFGSGAAEHSALWLVMDEPPREGEEKVIYVEAGGGERRNPFSEETEVSFAKICWECWTKDGFVPMPAKDGTHGFLVGGYLKLTQPKGCKAVRLEENGISGYVWRARLVRSEYDAPPVLQYMSGFLFPVYQKETKAAVYSFHGAAKIVLDGSLPENSHFRVYAKEYRDGSYAAYEESTETDDRGRCYRRERNGQGKDAVVFDRERYGCAPGCFQDAVRIVVYGEEMMQKYSLGDVFGYDGQEIRLPGKHVLTSDFAVIAKRVLPDGKIDYDFLKPGRQSGQDMHYSLYGSEGKMVIQDPGTYVGAKLYLASFAVTLGPEGNVRAGSEFLPTRPFCGDGIRFFNPASGRGGSFRETFEQMRWRLAKDLGKMESAVTPSDYEALVRRLPGLCIDKVHAWMDHEKNEVQITVLPGSRKAFPRLSEKYLYEIEKWLYGRRLLSTRIQIRQPVYAAVMTSGTIYVKPHYQGCREQIESAVRTALDYAHGSMGFGERLRFDRIFHEVENLDCVSYIQELVISPQNTTHVTMDGTDIIPDHNCLLYPGHVRLDILPQPGGR